jgi:hypothetical protein
MCRRLGGEDRFVLIIDRIGRSAFGRRALPYAALAAVVAALIGAGGALAPRAASASATATAPGDTVALARAVGSAYEAEERGVVAFDVTQNSAIRGTLFHRDDLDVTAFVESDGKLSHKAVLRHVEGGKSDDRAALAKRDAEPESPLSRFGMRLPCDPAAQADYAFGAPKPQGDGVVLPFRARVRDQAHGDGAIVFEPAGPRIASIDFVPAVPPDRASAATVSIAFGQLAAGRYGIARIVRTFDGHVGPLRGRVTSTSAYGNVRVFGSASAAAEAIDRER